MSLLEKSKENLDVAEHFIRKGKNVSAIVGNAYYAVFQRVKDFLITNQFNYDQFLQEKKAKPEERAFSHGTIRQAVQHYLITQQSGDLRAIAELTKMDKLYFERRRAHYGADIIENKVGQTCVDYAKTIITTIDSFQKP
jgi:hypothetical protein